jgi:hypothetical protein
VDLGTTIPLALALIASAIASSAAFFVANPCFSA